MDTGQNSEQPLVTNAPPPEPAEPVPSPKPKIKRLPYNFKLALILFGATGSLLLATVPKMFVDTSVDTPDFMVFLIAGLIGILITTGLFYTISKLGMSFGKTALAFAVGYNSMIVIVKLILSPLALYSVSQNGGFNTQSGDPNNVFYYILSGIVVFLLYIMVFKSTYRFYQNRYLDRMGQRAEQAVKKNKSAKRIIGTALYMLVMLAIILIALFGGAFSYLSSIFEAYGLAIVIALGLAYFLAKRSFAAVEENAINLRDSTLLASFFWVGLSLIILYHVMWIVFMVTLVSTWPFNTYTPK